MDNTTKCCSSCRQELPTTSFNKRRDGLQPKCKKCQSEYQKQYARKQNPEARAKANRKWRLNKEFGLSVDQYRKLSEHQNHVCAICSKPEELVHYRTGKTSPLSVDHNHLTGQVRGLLCNKCNTGLGKFDDNPELLACALIYLRRAGN